MSDNAVTGQKPAVSPFNTRALMAILSRLISGSILSLMFHQYFSSTGTGSAFVTSRLWWEIALNLQLLSAGMMWFSYVDRISEEKGRLRTLQLTKCWMAIFAVCTPFVVSLIAVLNDWFIAKPPPLVFGIIAGLAALHLAVSLTVYRMIGRYRQKQQKKSTIQRLVFFAPSLLFTLMATVCVFSGDTIWFSLTPLFLFMQGSMPYVMEIAGVTEPEAYSAR